MLIGPAPKDFRNQYLMEVIQDRSAPIGTTIDGFTNRLLSLSSRTFEAGKYRIANWHHISSSKAAKNANTRIRWRPQGGAWEVIEYWNDGLSNDNAWRPRTAAIEIQLLNPSKIELWVEYGSSNGGGIVYVRNIYWEIWKVEHIA